VKQAVIFIAAPFAFIYGLVVSQPAFTAAVRQIGVVSDQFKSESPLELPVDELSQTATCSPRTTTAQAHTAEGCKRVGQMAADELNRRPGASVALSRRLSAW
jgi:hypothetical protein